MMPNFSGPCPVCNGTAFENSRVLWKELVTAWQLSGYEEDYINRQQGFHCSGCTNNLRAMALASALLNKLAFKGTLGELCRSGSELSVLEINHAGQLNPTLQLLKNHQLIEYPQFDMTNLAFDDEQYDIVVHSDTLEHVATPERGLSECRRVLKPGGYCIFTIPIVAGRLSRSREGLAPSYHGRAGDPANDQVVVTEFGADFWKFVFAAGFKSCEIFSLEYPAALALIATK